MVAENITPEKNTQRKLERSMNSTPVSKAKSTLFTALHTDAYTFWCIKNVFSELTNKNLEKWKWPYKNNYFSPKTNELIDTNKYWSLDFFKNINLLEDMLSKTDNTLNFDCNKEARNKCNQMIESLITNPIIDEKNNSDSIVDKNSLQNFHSAVNIAQTEWKKIVILSNHQNHMDTFILNYIFHNLHELSNKQYDIPQKELRFICGAYMYYMNNTRAAPIGFDTTFVFWVKDMPEIVNFFKQEKNIKILKDIKKVVANSIKSNHESESSLLYVYAWRSDEDNGCKSKIEQGIEPFVSNEDCVYIPIWFNGSSSLYIDSDKTILPKKLIKIINPNKEIPWFVYFKPSEIKMTIWKHFQWWDKTLDEINTQMHQVSNDALAKRTKK